MTATPTDAVPNATPQQETYSPTSTILTAAAVFISSASFNLWWPFLPLYVLDLGASSDANALFWVAVATTSQGIFRLASSPLWGVLADRLGRKIMFLRTLYLAAITGVVAALVAEPWQLAIALGLQGIFSGFAGPAVALVSVSVPDEKLNSSISMINGGQYLGSTVGPAIGAALAIALGFRGTILLAAMLPLLAGALVHAFVPRDRVQLQRREGQKGGVLEPFRPGFQFYLAVFIFTMLFATTQLSRFVTPIALSAIENTDDVKAISGVAFSMGGAFSAVSVLFIAGRVFKLGRMRKALTAGFLVCGAGMLLLAFAGAAPVYIAGFVLITLMISAMVPAANTLIAMNVSRARRGTAFGVAASAQAFGLMIGPFSAAAFAAVSLEVGFVLLAALMAALALLMTTTLREPGQEGAEQA